MGTLEWSSSYLHWLHSTVGRTPDFGWRADCPALGLRLTGDHYVGMYVCMYIRLRQLTNRNIDNTDNKRKSKR